MPSAKVSVKNIRGILPALEPKDVQQPFVVEGQNFAVDFEGPYAAFANQYGAYVPFTDPDGMDDFQCGTETLYFCSNGVFSYDSTGMWLIPRYVFSEISGTKYPWSMGVVNGVYYFTRRGLGDVISYDQVNQIWGLLSTTSAIYLPATITGVCKSYGRLMILGQDKNVWSAQDDGTNLIPDLTTGAGFQKLSTIIGPSVAQFIVETFDGVIIFTDSGMMKGEIVDLPTIYRWYVLSKRDQAINPFCIAETNQLSYMILTAQGFVSTNGLVPKPEQDVFNEFLVRKLFPTYFDLTTVTLFRLNYDKAKKFLMLSVATEAAPLSYYIAYVLYMPRDEWGTFNFNHKVFGNYNLGTLPNQGLNQLGYVDLDGYIHKFITASYSEPAFDASANFLYRPVDDPPSHFEGANLVAESRMRISERDISKYKNLLAGLYTDVYATYGPDPVFGDYPIIDSTSLVVVSAEDWLYLGGGVDIDEDWAAGSPATFEDWGSGDLVLYVSDSFFIYDGETIILIMPTSLVLGGVNAYVDIGLFRFNDNQYIDEMSRITNLAVGMFNNTPVLAQEDWLNFIPDPTFEDWNTSSPQVVEDWGLDVQSSSKYGASIIATNDATNVFNQVTPVLVTDVGDTQYYSSDISGIWQQVEFTADNVGESFHLRFLELSGALAGRLNG